MVDTIRRPGDGAPKGPLMDAGQFRDYVLGLLARRFPDRHFKTAEDDPQILVIGEAKAGLQNIYKSYRILAEMGEPYEEAVVDHFKALLAEKTVAAGSLPKSWEEARGRLRLQLMPATFADKAPVLAFPFLNDVLIGVVCDAGGSYAYVRPEDAMAWGKTAQELHELAERNLSEASTGLQVIYIPSPNAVIIVKTMDGYDAARILLPRTRALALERLGSPVLAGIPNRDFLILWSAKNDAEFHRAVRAQIAADAVNMPHPLTGAILSVTAGGMAPESR